MIESDPGMTCALSAGATVETCPEWRSPTLTVALGDDVVTVLVPAGDYDLAVSSGVVLLKYRRGWLSGEIYLEGLERVGLPGASFR